MVKKAGVIGHPVNHSKSPLIHNHWIAEHGLQGDYKAIDIAPNVLEAGVTTLIDEGYAGFNVTIPHKQAIINLCAEIDDVARAIGAVNTVTIQNRKLYGSNTDAFGFIQNLKSSDPDIKFGKEKIVVLGAGGAARAIVYGLMQEGAENILITNRTEEKSYDIQKMNPDVIHVGDWEKRSELLEGASLLVNTTSLGMRGKDELEIDLSLLPKDAIVTDIVYVPLMTDLLLQAKERGNPVVTGIGMLLHQARSAFQKWFDVLPEVTRTLEEKVLA